MGFWLWHFKCSRKRAMRLWPLVFICAAAYAQITPVSVEPSAGGATTQNFSFVFTDPNGPSDLSVVNILINDALDGRHAFYLAFTGGNTLNLVDDAGDAAGPFATSPMSPTLANPLQNSQCTVLSGSLSTNGNTLSLYLTITASASFIGNRLIYLAARSATANSGWQPLGVWSPSPAPLKMDPARSIGLDQTYTFRVPNLPIVDILINSALDGRHACYVAFVTATKSLFLVDDAGDAGGPYSGTVLPAPAGTTFSNSQCTIDAGASSISINTDTLTLTLAITFSPSFSGNHTIYAASSSWQAVGTVSIGPDSLAPTIS